MTNPAEDTMYRKAIFEEMSRQSMLESDLIGYWTGLLDDFYKSSINTKILSQNCKS